VLLEILLRCDGRAHQGPARANGDDDGRDGQESRR